MLPKYFFSSSDYFKGKIIKNFVFVEVLWKAGVSFMTSFEGPKPNLGSFDSKLNEAAVGFGDELTKRI